MHPVDLEPRFSPSNQLSCEKEVLVELKIIDKPFIMTSIYTLQHVLHAESENVLHQHVNLGYKHLRCVSIVWLSLHGQ